MEKKCVQTGKKTKETEKQQGNTTAKATWSVRPAELGGGTN